MAENFPGLVPLLISVFISNIQKLVLKNESIISMSPRGIAPKIIKAALE